jgi:hypothetical protein
MLTLIFTINISTLQPGLKIARIRFGVVYYYCLLLSQRTSDMRKIIRAAILIAVTTITSNFASASLIFESGGGNATSSGLIVADSNWVYHRFELTNQITISAIGGLFGDVGGNSFTLFGGVIALENEFDLPNSFDLDTDDLLGTNTFTVSGESAEHFTDLSLTLDTGWYSLVFGTGAFGADSVPFEDYLIMNGVENDLDPNLSYVGLRPGNPILDPYQYSFQASTHRFLVVAEIPEPAALSLIGISLLMLFRRYGK